MEWFTIVCFTIATVSASAYRPNTPLIKNVFRGGEHFEGPHFAKDESAMYWVDITQQNVLRMDIDTRNVTSRHIGYGQVSLVVRVKDYPKLLIVTARSELYLLSWDAPEGDSALRLLSSVDIGLPDNRCNDGKVDANGRLWVGTMGKEGAGVIDKDQGTLYMVTQYNHQNPEVKVRPVSISNGIAWTSDNKFMFYIDTPTRNIDVFDFNVETGSIGNRRVLFSFQANNVTGLPDGMTIDRDGNLWVACYGGGKVIKIDSRAGKLLEQHTIPASQVTSVSWGGYDFSTLYVTTSSRGLTQIQKAKEPEAGSLFAIDYTGSSGYPDNQFLFPNADKYYSIFHQMTSY